MEEQQFENRLRKWAIEMPEEKLPEGHYERFTEKLKLKEKQQQPKRLLIKWSIAAGFLLLTGMGLQFFTINNGKSTSLEQASKMENYLSGIVALKVTELQGLTTAENKVIIDWVLQEMESLDKDYQQLKKKLEAGINERRILYELMENFRLRQELLEQVIIQLEKNNNNEQEFIM